LYIQNIHTVAIFSRRNNDRIKGCSYVLGIRRKNEPNLYDVPF
jgi:hypothetical protein